MVVLHCGCDDILLVFYVQRKHDCVTIISTVIESQGYITFLLLLTVFPIHAQTLQYSAAFPYKATVCPYIHTHMQCIAPGINVILGLFILCKHFGCLMNLSVSLSAGFSGRLC